jgi:hypothetical protein
LSGPIRDEPMPIRSLAKAGTTGAGLRCDVIPQVGALLMQPEALMPRLVDAGETALRRPDHDNSELLVLDQLKHFSEVLEDKFSSDVLSLIGPIHFGIEKVVREVVEGREHKRHKLLVLVETDGGYIEVTQRIADTIRHHYRQVEFVIAMSAGTVLVMSGDAIWMDYYSVLGPIDPQVSRPGGSMVPALGYLLHYDRLIKRAEQKLITSAEVIYLVANFNPAELYLYEQASDLSIALLKEWLVKYKFKNWTRTETHGKKVTNSMRARRAEKVARVLQDTRRWNSHGRGISMEVLRREVNLKIDDFSENLELLQAIRKYYRLLIDYMTNLGDTSVIHSGNQYHPIRRRDRP